MIRLENVIKKYTVAEQEEIVLDNLSYQFKRGVKTSILGPSGCGKTTTLNLIGGIDSEYEGNIYFNDELIEDLDKYRREHISFIFQDLNLINNLNLIKNITIGLTNDVDNKEEIALKMLDKVGLKEHAYKMPNQLSGGERQRVAIARALSRESDVLLCDEPTGSLDDEIKYDIMDLIMSVFSDKTVIFITHDEEVAFKYSDEVLGFKEGQLTALKEAKGKELSEVSNAEQTFDGRFEVNLLTRKFKLFNASYLIIIIFAIFLYGMGVVKGLENEIDQYFIDKYKVNKIDVLIYRGMSYDGFTRIVEDYNEEHDKIVGTMVEIGSNLQIDEVEYDFKLFGVSPEIRETMEEEIVAGRYPDAAKEILYSKQAAQAFLYHHECNHQAELDELVDEVCLQTVLEYSNEVLLTRISNLDISYTNAYRFNPERIFDEDLTIVGLIDDLFGEDPTTYDDNLPLNRNIYFMEEDFRTYISRVYLGNYGVTSHLFSIFIEKEDLDLRAEVFEGFLFGSNLVAGRDRINHERFEYFDELAGYRVVIVIGSSILTLFGAISVYNGIKTNIEKNKYNVGVYSSLGYSKKNIRSMFFKEGLIISFTILFTSLIIWLIFTLFMDIYIINAIDRSNFFGFERASTLNLFATLIVTVIINLIISGSIYYELRKINILELVRN